MRILLCCVPFGCDNIGDEAILIAQVAILRAIDPALRITVATRNPRQTCPKLDVDTCPLLGHDVRHPAEIKRHIAKQDIVIWAGATGLSDYPEVALRVLACAQGLGKRCVIFGTGMNNRLNPAFYTVGPGKRRLLLQTLTRASLGRWNAVRWYERRLAARAHAQMATVLPACALIALRDEPSQQALTNVLPDLPSIASADPAILLEPDHHPMTALPACIREAIAAEAPRVGICISAQGAVRNRQALTRLLNDLLAIPRLQLFGLSMNPITDRALMSELRPGLSTPDRFHLPEGLEDPILMAKAAGTMQVVISSRLHLLILASISHVPLVGISRGSKVDNFLALYGERPAGSFEDLNPEHCLTRVRHFLADPSGLITRSQSVRAQMLARLEAARAALGELLHDNSL